MDVLKISRRATLLSTLALTTFAVFEGFNIATTISDWGKDGIGAAAVIAAITGPVSALQGYVLKHHDYKSNLEKPR
jgi:hypothetical protein